MNQIRSNPDIVHSRAISALMAGIEYTPRLNQQ
jgi:hypothetical protein